MPEQSNANKKSRANKYLFHVILNALTENDTSFLFELGVPAEDIEWLSKLSAVEVKKIANSDKPIFELSASAITKNFEHLKTVIENHRKQQELIKQFIIAGASLNMMYELFGLSRLEYTTTNHMNNIKRRGRCCQLSPEEAKTAISIWKQNQHLTPYERYLEIAKQMDANLGSVYKVINPETVSFNSQTPREYDSIQTPRMAHAV